MSDFDKEAEREKLRKRFAEEEKDREATERMSELLLQGATMTDTHCDTCGDPLFRYDGQTFCPTCQRVTDEGETDTTQTTTNDAPTANDEPTPHTMDDGQRIAVDDPHETQPQEQTREAKNTNTAEARQPNRTPTRNRRSPPSQTGGGASDSETPTGGASRSEHHNDLAATEASLSRTLRQLASTAEETNDLGRTREHLAATREAAEALDAVRTVRR